MVLGEPGDPNKKQPKARAEASSAIAEFDLAQTWNDIPKPVRYGVPAILVALIAYMYSGGGEASQPYQDRATDLVRAVIKNNKSGVVAYATTSTADAAGKWFDLMHAQVEQNQIGSDVSIVPNLFSGNAEKDSDITLLVVLSKDSATAAPPVAMTLYMKKDGNNWMLDGEQTLSGAEKAAASTKKK